MNRKRLRIPLLHEALIPIDYSEHGVEKGAKFTNEGLNNHDLANIIAETKDMDVADWVRWLEEHKSEFESSTIIANTDDGDSLIQLSSFQPTLIIEEKSLNLIRHLNTLLNRANETLIEGGYFWCHCRTASLKRMLILEKYPIGINYFVYGLHYIWHRVIPKMNLTKTFYFAITKGRNRTFNRVEVLGRMYRAGFEVIDEGFRHGEFFVLARKAKTPIWDDVPSGSFLIKLRRIGKGGKLIDVYKFRTMYSYSEYLQPYIYEHNKLKKGGKFDDDYRVTPWGKWMRKTWIDELPMLINILKGDLKIVGVRPLSKHFYSLYNEELQQLRIQSKPGLLPPGVAERKKPITLDDVQESERKYLNAYFENPFTTDIKYFFKVINNILLRGRRSE